jgi:hypothetical protein
MEYMSIPIPLEDESRLRCHRELVDRLKRENLTEQIVEVIHEWRHSSKVAEHFLKESHRHDDSLEEETSVGKHVFWRYWASYPPQISGNEVLQSDS